MLYLNYNQNVVLKLDTRRVSNISSDIKDKDTHFLELNDTQEKYYEQHPLATSKEIWEASLGETTVFKLSIEQRREREYRNRIPRSMIDSYITYQAEGDLEKAQAVASKIAAIKAEIRSQYKEEEETL